jgi:hypothetical protein
MSLTAKPRRVCANGYVGTGKRTSVSFRSEPKSLAANASENDGPLRRVCFTVCRCGRGPGPGKTHGLICKRPTGDGAWHKWNEVVVASEAFDRIVLGVANQTHVQNHLLATLWTLNQHAYVCLPFNWVRTHLRHLNSRLVYFVSYSRLSNRNSRARYISLLIKKECSPAYQGQTISRRADDSSCVRSLRIDYRLISGFVVQQNVFPR